MTPAGSVCRVVAGAATLAGALAATPSSTVLVASPAPIVLNLSLTATHELAPLTRLALVSETEWIWKQGNVRLRWVDRDAADEPMLPVLVMATLVPPAGSHALLTVGELVRREGTPAVAIASLTGARRIVEERQRAFLLDPPATRERRVGVVLGRALAHEIGHYLLQTNTHAVDGLMRARIRAQEFADLRREAFRLDRAAAAHLAAVAETGSLVPPAPPFSYESQ